MEIYYEEQELTSDKWEPVTKYVQFVIVEIGNKRLSISEIDGKFCIYSKSGIAIEVLKDTEILLDEKGA